MNNVDKRKCLSIVAVLVLAVGMGSVSAADEVGSKQYRIRIVQISDTQPPLANELVWQRTAEAIDLVNSLAPDIIIFPGDVTDNGTEAGFKRMKELIGRIRAPVHIVAGNHDTMHVTEDDKKAFPGQDVRALKNALFEKYLDDTSWSVEFDDFQFIGLEPESAWKDIPPERREWLVKTCRSSSKPYKFLVTHFPPNPADGPERRGGDRGNLYEALDAAGVIGYMHGHTHRIEAARDPETGRLVFNSGSATLIPERGVMYFDVYGDMLVCFWRPVKGEARPLGTFDLKKTQAAFSEGRKVLNEVD